MAVTGLMHKYDCMSIIENFLPLSHAEESRSTRTSIFGLLCNPGVRVLVRFARASMPSSQQADLFKAATELECAITSQN